MWFLEWNRLAFDCTERRALNQSSSLDEDDGWSVFCPRLSFIKKYNAKNEVFA